MATSTYELIVKAVDQTGGSLNKVNKNLQKTNKSAGQLKVGIAAIGAALATLGAGQAIRNIVGITGTFQDLKSTLGSVLGDMNKGNRAFEAITNLSTKTQFGVEDLSSTFIRLAAAGIQPTTKLFKTFTDAAAVTTDQVGVLNAMTEVFTRTTQSGVVELMEFDKLADRGLPVYDILKQKLGVTRNELSEFSKEAGGAARVLEALEEGINERFGGATESRLKNLSVAQSNFSIELRKAANTIGEQFAPALTDALDKLTAFVATQKPLLEAIGTGFKVAIEGASKGLSIFAENIDVVRNVLLVAFAGPALKAVMAVGRAFLAIAAPVRLVKMAILGAVAAATFFQDTTVNLGETTATFGEVFKAVFDLIGDKIKQFANFMGETFTNVKNFVMQKVEQFQQPFADTFTKIGGIVKGAINFIINSFIAAFTQIKNIVFQIPQFFIGAFNGVMEVASAFGNTIVQKFTNIGSAIKLALKGEFGAAMKTLGQDTGFDFAESFKAGFGESGISLIDTSDIFAQDRVADAVEFVVTKGGELATFVEGKLTPVYGELKDAILKKIEANRAELKQIEDTNKANLETVETLDDITIKASETSDAVIKQQEKVKTLAEQINESITENGKSFSQSLARNLAQGKASLSDFSSFVNKVLEDIAAMIIQKRITDPLIEGILGGLGGAKGGGGIGGTIGSFISGLGSGGTGGGFSFGNMFSSIGSFFGLANGGIAKGNKPYMVGERGPEMFIPNTTGKVISNEELGRGGETVVNFNINAISTQTGMEFLLKNKPQIIGMVSQAQNHRGRAGITS
mgnify:CR=1 FL=1